MCGITGIYNFKNNRTVTEKEVAKMRDTLVHRGPDGKGSFLSTDGKVGLGHRRLAIIDLSEKNSQPMIDKDGRVQLVYNGEIYNFKKLRSELQNKGYEFKTEGDTEVVVNAYLQWGPDCVRRFNGMFAFALWDKKEKRLFAARDQLGIKPFYYGVQNGAFFFGSEIKAILANKNFDKKLAKENISYFLTFASMPAPYTLFQDINKLEPAHYLTVDSQGKMETKEYWNPARNNDFPKGADEDYYIKKVREILKDSVRSQMVADVPFGCFLSGGIDSSTNATLMSEAMGEPVETFSIAAKNYPGYSEFEYSRKIADILGANTHETTVDEKDLIRFLPEYAKYADDPNGDQICFLIYYISKLIRDSGTVVAQVGEGADEIFAGYPTYQLAVNLYENIWRYAEKLPSFVKNSPYSMLHPLGFAKLDFPLEYMRKLGAGEEPFWSNAIAFTPHQKRGLLTEEYKAELQGSHEYNIVREQYEKIDKLETDADFLERLTYLELKVRLPEILLMRVDKMSMAHSIEARVPFLDHRLVELALHIPQNLKLKNNETKYILKKAVEGIIPDDIIYRKKQGFAAPMTEWLRNTELSEVFRDTIKNSGLADRNIMNYDYVDKVIEDHCAGRVDNNFQIWNLVALSLWHNKWFG